MSMAANISTLQSFLQIDDFASRTFTMLRRGNLIQPVDINSIRKAHLKRLIDECGSVKEFADKVNTNADYLSSILSPKALRNPGARLMRRVEKTFKLKVGSLDLQDELSSEIAELCSTLPLAVRQEILHYARFKAQTLPAPFPTGTPIVVYKVNKGDINPDTPKS